MDRDEEDGLEQCWLFAGPVTHVRGTDLGFGVIMRAPLAWLIGRPLPT